MGCIGEDLKTKSCTLCRVTSAGNIFAPKYYSKLSEKRATQVSLKKLNLSVEKTGPSLSFIFVLFPCPYPFCSRPKGTQSEGERKKC